MDRYAFAETHAGYRYKSNNPSVRPRGSWEIGAPGLWEEVLEPAHETLEKRVVRRVSVYRAGVFEWAHRYGTVIPTISFAEHAHDALLYGARIFEEVGYGGRLLVWVRIENADHAELSVSDDFGVRTRAPEEEWVGSQQEVPLDRLLYDPTPIVRTAMDYVWQGFGLAKCSLFDADGDWV